MSIGINQIVVNLIGRIGLPELKVGRTLQQFLNTFRLLYTRKFHQDTAGLLQLLNVRSNNAETVDTVAEYVERIAQGSLHLLLDNRKNFRIRRILLYLVLQLISAEHLSETCIRIDFAEIGSESIQELVTAGSLCRLSLSQSLDKSRVVCILGSQRLQYVGN